VVVEKITSALREHEQVILFQNRRGYAPYLQCGHCGWIPQCPNCDVSLTYYKYTHELRCHYCNYRSKTYTECTVCKQKNLALKGTGTEKLEDELQQLFPQARVARMDYDTTRTKYSQNKLISDVEQRQIDILVGTQMVTKGLDFAHVSTIVIPEADRLFAYPDFRSHERAFQLLMQVSGRAGRRHKQGQVLIQAFNIDHPVIQFVLQNDYRGFFEYEITVRKEFSYPPFVRLINIELKHADKNALMLATNYLYDALHKTWEQRVLHPVEPVVNKVQNKYRMHILLKLEKDPKVLASCKQHILKCIDTMQFHPSMRQTDILTDVDPY
jgi:primosomal protein N' (replication factor Y)